jgi:hypothetical protein
MGYTTNIRAVKRVEDYLRQMVESTETLTWTPPDGTSADRLAYHIREGWSAAKHRAIDSRTNEAIEPYHSYAQLPEKFILKAQGGVVVARPRVYLPTAVRTKQALGVMHLPNLRDELEVIGAAMTHQAEEMHFPDALKMDFEAVDRWASMNGYQMATGASGTLLTKRQLGDLAWQPEETSSEKTSS